MVKKIKVGIVGFGLSGAIFHAPVIAKVKSLELAAIVSSQTQKVKEKYPSVKVYAEASQLFSDPDIDLVVITAPNEQHYPLAKMALEANKHVVVEKPFVVNAQQGEQLIDLARHNKLVLSVYQNRRWDNDFLALKACIQSGRLGDIHYAEMRFERFRSQLSEKKWREEQVPGAGILYDLGSHLIDSALCLFGWPKSVYADIDTQRPLSQVADFFHIILGYDHLKVILHASALVKKPGPRYLVHGNKGSFIKYGLDPQEAILRALHENQQVDPCLSFKNFFDNSIEIMEEVNGLNLEGTIHLPMGRYQAYYEQLYEAIANNAIPPVKPEDALNGIKIIELAMKSHGENRKIILTP